MRSRRILSPKNISTVTIIKSLHFSDSGGEVGALHIYCLEPREFRFFNCKTKTLSTLSVYLFKHFVSFKMNAKQTEINIKLSGMLLNRAVRQ